MKKHFITGLAIILPLVLTYWVAKFFVNILTKPFIGLMEWILLHLSIINQTTLVTNPKLLLPLAEILSLIFFISIVFVIGVLARWYFFHLVVAWTDKILHAIPLVNRVYKASKEVVKNLFHSEKASFKQVVLVPYPHADVYAMGFITNDSEEKSDLISVLIPGTPNPIIGFVLMFDKKDILYIDMPVSSALQTMISCGAKMEPFSFTEGRR